MFMKLGILFLAITFSLVAIAGIVIQQTGVLVVDVQSRDGRVYLPIPMLLVNTALSIAPISGHVKIPEELNSHSDMVQAAANALLDCPDGTFVEVETPRKTVLVAKKGENIIVDVKSEDEKVHVRVPIRATGKVFAKLASLESNSKGENEFNIIGEN